MAIGFHNAPARHFPDKNVLKKCLKALAEKHRHKILQLDFVFVSDPELLEMNQTYLGHDYFTDIITFDQSEKSGELEGDIYISTDRVEENGLKIGAGIKEEYIRVCCHGLLHLCGLKDKTPAEAEKMRAGENDGIVLYFSLLQKNQ